jgi:hypothetical protein
MRPQGEHAATASKARECGSVPTSTIRRSPGFGMWIACGEFTDNGAAAGACAGAILPSVCGGAVA